jgi:hypothetical protein
LLQRFKVPLTGLLLEDQTQADIEVFDLLPIRGKFAGGGAGSQDGLSPFRFGTARLLPGTRAPRLFERISPVCVG